MLSPKISVQQAATRASQTECNDNIYTLEDGTVVCLNSNDEKGKEEAKKQAHLDRNYFQKGKCPIDLGSYAEGVFDKTTKTDWERDRFGVWWTTETVDGKKTGPHVTKSGKEERCYRGKPSPDEIQALKKDCRFRRNVKALGENPDTVTPGFQCCYDPDSKKLSGSSTFDYQTPGGLGGVIDHRRLDVNTHNKYKADPYKGNAEDMQGGTVDPREELPISVPIHIAGPIVTHIDVPNPKGIKEP